MSDKYSAEGSSLLVVVFIVFLILKLTGLIDWSWWWVTAPLWISLLSGIAILAVIGIAALIFSGIYILIEWWKKLE